MKKIVSSFMLLCILSNTAFAQCDFKSGIVEGKTPDGLKFFAYTEECHKKVGQLVQDNKTKDAQLTDLSKAITLKDLALSKADERTQLWITTSDNMQDRLTKIDETVKKNEFLYFGLGVLATFLAGYGAAKLAGR